MASRVTATLLALALLAPTAATGQRRRREAPIPLPQTNIPDRKPMPDPAIEDRKPGAQQRKQGSGLWSSVKGAFARGVALVRSWHGSLSRLMPSAVAWAVMGTPLYLLLVLILVRRRRGRAPTRARKSTPAPTRPVSPAVRAAAEGPRKEEEIAALEHSPAEQLLLAGPMPLHEAFVVLGPDELALSTLRDSFAAKMDELAWSAAVHNTNTRLLEPVRQCWIKALVAARLKAWLQADPLVAQAGLEVTVPELHEVTEVGSLALIQPSGLGADLSEAQESLVQHARTALQQVWEVPSPHALMVVGRRSKITALLGDATIDLYALALLLHGVQALDNGATAQANPVELSAEFRRALAEHRRISELPVGGEGCAVHALHAAGGGCLDGIGTLCAAAGGAAFSAMAVTLKLSKVVSGLSSPQQEACQRLGELAASALADARSADGTTLTANIHSMLGGALLEVAARRAEDLVHVARRLNKQPLWTDTAAAPDLALARLHRSLLQNCQRQSEAARRRLLEIFARLAYEGQQQDNRALAHCRLGYAVAGLGTALLRSTSTDLLSAGREAVAALTPG